MLAVILALLLGSIIFIPFGFILDFSLDGNKNRIAVLFWVINPTISAGLEIKGQPVLHSLKGDWWKKIIPGKKKHQSYWIWP